MKYTISILILCLFTANANAQLKHLGNLRNTFFSSGLEFQIVRDSWEDIIGQPKKIIWGEEKNSKAIVQKSEYLGQEHRTIQLEFDKSKRLIKGQYFSDNHNEEITCQYDKSGNLTQDKIIITSPQAGKEPEIEEYYIMYKKFFDAKDSSSILIACDTHIDGEIKSFRADKINYKSNTREQFIATFDKSVKKSFPSDGAFLVNLLTQNGIREYYEKEQIIGFFYKKNYYDYKCLPTAFQQCSESREQFDFKNLDKNKGKNIFKLSDQNNTPFGSIMLSESHPDGNGWNNKQETNEESELKLKKLTYTEAKKGFYNEFGMKMPFLLQQGEFEIDSIALGFLISNPKFTYDKNQNWIKHSYTNIQKPNFVDDNAGSTFSFKYNIKREITYWD